jgi:Transposase DDE domain
VASYTWTRNQVTRKNIALRDDDRALKSRESWRWFEQVLDAEDVLEGHANAVHLMDAEADIYWLLSRMEKGRFRYVIRTHFNRVIEDALAARLHEKVSAFVAKTVRLEVPLSKRVTSKSDKNAKQHPSRNERLADLEISACEVTLCAPADVDADSPKRLTLNVVRVFERHPPPGEKSVEWTLATSEPILTIESLEKVVDAYRSRWVIEEFFKALKTGCTFEQRQLQSYSTITKALAVYSVVAYELLRMRSLAHTSSARLASEELRPIIWQLLLRHPYSKLTETSTISEAYLAIAALGGHFKHNGLPGWLILLRGYHKLLTMEEGAYLIDKSKRYP